MRFIKKNALIKILYDFLMAYPAPCSLSYFWNFGSLALLFLIIQIITGVFLAMYYTADALSAFDSVEYIMRNVNNGWLIRYLHSNGASMFFIVVYIHMFRGLYYNSYIYPRQKLWNSGVVLLLLMIITAFLGYVLPWGQMSFWGATVITNLVSAIPFIGEEIMYWLWGGFSVENPTLTRFFSLHFVLPFIIFGVSCIHLLFLHEHGSNNSLGVVFKQSYIFFSPYFIYKDLVGVLLFCYFYFFLFFFHLIF